MVNLITEMQEIMCRSCTECEANWCDGEDKQECCWMEKIAEVGQAVEQEIRVKAINEAIEASAKAICIGCGYLEGYKCTYKGGNCTVSKPMLEVVVKALEQMKGGAV